MKACVSKFTKEGCGVGSCKITVEDPCVESFAQIWKGKWKWMGKIGFLGQVLEEMQVRECLIGELTAL